MKGFTFKLSISSGMNIFRDISSTDYTQRVLGFQYFDSRLYRASTVGGKWTFCIAIFYFLVLFFFFFLGGGGGGGLGLSSGWGYILCVGGGGRGGVVPTVYYKQSTVYYYTGGYRKVITKLNIAERTWRKNKEEWTHLVFMDWHGGGWVPRAQLDRHGRWLNVDSVTNVKGNPS